MNKLYFGDNLTILKELPDNSIDLIYADPPFNTGRDWGAYNDKWEKGLAGYLDFMKPRIEEIHRVLNDTGSFYLHCDPTASHYLKVLCDQVFGITNFRNEIVYYRKSQCNNTIKKFSVAHDYILFYARSKKTLFNPVYLPKGKLSKNTLKEYRHTNNEGEKYKITTDRGGKITRTYFKNIKGLLINSVWVKSSDFPGLGGSSRQRTGYPTQKPIALLERIIKASSNEGDVVLDPFVGSGTSLDAAHGLQRNWIGIDEGQQAIETITFRLADQHGLLPNHDYELLGRTDSIKLPTAQDATPQQTKLFEHMTNTEFVFVYSLDILKIHKAFKSCVEHNEYPWVNGHPPQFFKRVLVTPIANEKQMNQIVSDISYLRNAGDHSFLMFDSGGFQVETPTNDITPANIVERNLYLYNTYDKADAYVLADVAISLRQTEQQQTENIKKTIKLTRELYERLPERIQVKCVPVYQVNKKEHIDMQFESHGKISQISGMTCYSIPAPYKKLTWEHMKWIMYLKSLQPDTKIHLLGCTSPPAFFAMQRIGADSCDSISPISIAAHGGIATYTGRIRRLNLLKHKNEHNIESIENFRNQTGHRCPFCDPENRKRLTENIFWRRMHNVMLYSEIGDYYSRFTLEQYKKFSKITRRWAVALEKALDSNIPVPEAVSIATPKNSPIVDDDMSTQLTLF